MVNLTEENPSKRKTNIGLSIPVNMEAEKLNEAITKTKELIGLLKEINGFVNLLPTEEIPKYPKRIMRLNELVEMGYSKEYLMKQYRTKGQKFARKQDPTRRNSPIIFDTELFEKQQRRQQELENQQIRRG